MHASVWRFAGDPDELVRRYDAMIAEIPAASMRLHLCLRAEDGIVLVRLRRENVELRRANATRPGEGDPLHRSAAGDPRGPGHRRCRTP